MKTATTLFCRLFWENESNEEKGQDENEDIELANNTNKNQEHENLFQKLQTHIEHSTNSTPPLGWRHLLMIEVKSANFKL